MSKFKETTWEIAKFIIFTLVVVVPIRTYVAQPFIVSGHSMVPTFEDGQYLIVDELSYHFRQPTRGEVVVFRYPKDETKFFIKRIINLPGETVELPEGGKRMLDKDEYFVMGDNRPASLDSRAWGPVKDNLITGRVLLRLFPLSKVGWLPGRNGV